MWRVYTKFCLGFVHLANGYHASNGTNYSAKCVPCLQPSQAREGSFQSVKAPSVTAIATAFG